MAYSDTVVKIHRSFHVKSEIIRGLGGVQKGGKSPTHYGYVYQSKPSSGHCVLFSSLHDTEHCRDLIKTLLAIEEVSYMLRDVMCLRGCGCTL